MKKYLIAAALALGALSAPVAQSEIITPNLVSAPWVIDRYPPKAHGNIGPFEGRTDVFGLLISPEDNFANRSSCQLTFCNTQGVQTPAPGAMGDTHIVDIFIPASWANAAEGNARADAWAALVNPLNQIVQYAIVGFTNYGGDPRWQIWNDTVWVPQAAPVKYGQWNSLAMSLTALGIQYEINDDPALLDATTGGATNFQTFFLQAYNAEGDPAVPNWDGMAYVAAFSNHQNAPTGRVPEPGTLALLATLIPVFWRMRKHRHMDERAANLRAAGVA